MVLVVKNLPARAGDLRDMGSVLELGRSPGEGRENSMDREAWRATVHRVGESDTTEVTSHACICIRRNRPRLETIRDIADWFQVCRCCGSKGRQYGKICGLFVTNQSQCPSLHNSSFLATWAILRVDIS